LNRWGFRSRLIFGCSRRRAAAERGAVRAWRETGARAAKCPGGDRRSERIEGYRSVILDAIDARADITLGEIAEILHTFAPSTVWRFLDRHAMTLKKQRTQPSRMCRKPTLGGIVSSIRSRLRRAHAGSREKLTCFVTIRLDCR
jgi:hypothetical protein